MILYFHGLGSNCDSSKFQILTREFSKEYSIDCVLWNLNTDFSELLMNLQYKISGQKDVVLIGSSTGGNYAYQLAEKLRMSNSNVKLILINPLLNVNNRIADFPFPSELLDSLIAIDEVNNCHLLISKNDEIINHNLIKIGKNGIIQYIDDNHKVKDFEKYLDVIRKWIED